MHDTKNTSLFLSDTILEIEYALQGQFGVYRKAPDPSILYDLNTLIEAIVFTNHVFIGPDYHRLDTDARYGQSVKREKLFSDRLRNENILLEVPLKVDEEIDAKLIQATQESVDYQYHDFLGSDLNSVRWVRKLFSSFHQHSHNNYDEYALDFFRRTRERAIGNVEFAESKGIQPCLPLSGRVFLEQWYRGMMLPHFDIYRRMVEKIRSLDDHFSPLFSPRSIDIPPLVQITAHKCRNREDLCDVILGMRDDFTDFRDTLTRYETLITTSGSKQELLDIELWFESAWEELMKRERSRQSRIVYKLWDIVKAGKLFGIFTKLMDALIEKDKGDQKLLKLNGAYDVWKALMNAPTVRDNITLYRKLFGREPSSKDLKEYSDYSRFLRSTFEKTE